MVNVLGSKQTNQNGRPWLGVKVLILLLLFILPNNPIWLTDCALSRRRGNPDFTASCIDQDGLLVQVSGFGYSLYSCCRRQRPQKMAGAEPGHKCEYVNEWAKPAGIFLPKARRVNHPPLRPSQRGLARTAGRRARSAALHHPLSEIGSEQPARAE